MSEWPSRHHASGRLDPSPRALVPAGSSTTSEPFHWPDAVLEAIMECDPAALARVLRTLTHAEVNSLLSRSSLDAQTPMFVLGGRLFLREGGTRTIFGGAFHFQREARRAQIGEWLDMIGAKHGDTLLHVALRVGGADDELKAATVVEVLGCGCTFERVNQDGELPAVIDKAIWQAAFFRALPRWRQERAREDERARVAELEANLMERQRARAERRDERRARKAEAAAEAKRRADREARKAAETLKHRLKLEAQLARVSAREDELKRTDLGATEIADDVISLLPFKLRKMLSLT